MRSSKNVLITLLYLKNEAAGSVETLTSFSQSTLRHNQNGAKVISVPASRVLFSQHRLADRSSIIIYRKHLFALCFGFRIK